MLKKFSITSAFKVASLSASDGGAKRTSATWVTTLEAKGTEGVVSSGTLSVANLGNLSCRSLSSAGVPSASPSTLDRALLWAAARLLRCGGSGW